MAYHRSRSLGVGAKIIRRRKSLTSICHCSKDRSISLTLIIYPPNTQLLHSLAQFLHKFIPFFCVFHLGFGLVSGRFCLSKTIIPEAQEHFLTPSARRDTHLFGGLGLIGRLSVYGPGAARLHEEIVPITARWFYPEQRQGPLVPFQRDGEHTTLESLRVALDEAGRTTVPERVHDILQQSAQQDIADLLPHLEARADGALKRAETMLAERAEAESQSMAGLLKSQQTRIPEAMGGEGFQMRLDLDPAELRQYEADRRAWERRLQAIEQELATEPARIADSYSIRAHRVDPIGLVYLWPKTG